MSVHVEKFDSEVDMVPGDLPLNERQIESLVTLIMARIEKKQREQQGDRAARSLRNSATPPSGSGP